MPTNISFNGTSYPVPLNGEKNWATEVFNYLQALALGTLQTIGGAFTLLADLNLGNTFGVIAAYFKSAANNIAQSGVLRLANADTIGFRNAGNSADLSFGRGSSDSVPNWAGIDLVNLSTAQTMTNKVLSVSTIVSSPSVAPSNFIFGASAGLNATTLTYLFPGWSNSTAGTTAIVIPMPFGGKFSNLYVWESGGSTTQGMTYQMVKNGSGQTITCTVPAGAGPQTANDTTHTFTCVAGDLIGITAAGVSGITGACGNIVAAVEFTQA